jgi:hypothetical protein
MRTHRRRRSSSGTLIRTTDERVVNSRMSDGFSGRGTKRKGKGSEWRTRTIDWEGVDMERLETCAIWRCISLDKYLIIFTRPNLGGFEVLLTLIRANDRDGDSILDLSIWIRCSLLEQKDQRNVPATECLEEKDIIVPRFSRTNIYFYHTSTKYIYKRHRP